MTSLTVHSCAKINLSLDIVGTRADGYHELRSVVHTLALHDTLRFEFGPPSTCASTSSEWRLECDDPSLQGEGNLCLKAARAWCEEARSNGGDPPAGMIVLTKRIPYGAGLGGGSGNAWATLAALSRALDPGAEVVPHARLLEIAAGLGADVPLFARGGALLLEGIGERITPLPPLQGYVVLAQPGALVSTPAAYRAWDESGAASSNATEFLLEAWQDKSEDEGSRRLERVAGRLGNDLRRSARALGAPVQAGIAALRRAGALGAEMTGSGSAVFGLCRDQAHAHSVEAAARDDLLERGEGWRLWSAPLCSWGARFEAEEAGASTSSASTSSA